MCIRDRVSTQSTGLFAAMTDATPPKSPIADRPKLKALVIDSGAIIRGVKFENYAESFFTVPSVISEIRDLKARMFLDTFPWEIKQEEPDSESMKEVIAFSKKTGDFSVLSPTDMKVLALTLKLSKQADTRFAPKPATPSPSPSVSPSTASPSNDSNSSSIPTTATASATKPPSPSTSPSSPSPSTSTSPSPSPAAPPPAIEDDGEGEWITPENIVAVTTKLNAKKLSQVNTEMHKVGCITGDFAMQNVLLQMKLHLISYDGLVIRQARSYVLSCEACFKTTKDVTKIFCPSCGNQTLYRLAVTVTETGVIYHHNKNRKPIKGQSGPLPLPKGGKKHMEPILTEDQLMEARRKYHQKKDKFDVFSDEWEWGQRKSQYQGLRIGFDKPKKHK
eukprot:TRINITY_DN1570_c0_g1_i2.p1 TRINITY_DN1570_c0_g1~~TRINITY_DN1570_c0_g1_i2.p1  ORF type:complete len:391 (+),score=100.65 TRINITY_DN1570_c0_g1_i2:24-1196(+)